MKVLFIYKYSFIEPIGLMYISAALKKAGHEAFYFDTELSTGLENYIQRLKPHIIAYSIVTGSHRFYADINRRLKQRFSFISIFGGPHATFFPEFIKEEGVDAVCRGEGEEAMVEFVNRLSKKESLLDIKNIFFKSNNTIHRNPLRQLEDKLDLIAFPDRELIYNYPQYKYRANKYVLTSRGCPFNCTYCFNHSLKALYKDKGVFCRKRSVDNVISEIEELRKIAPVQTVHFFDDVFILDKEWIMDFCQTYKETVNIPFNCYIRANLTDEEIIASLKDAGVHSITFAIETADIHLRNNVLKRNITDKHIFKTAELLHKYKIKFFTQNMVGLPGETIDNAISTVRLNAQCNPAYSLASIFQPYPGTELTQYAIQKGLYSKENEITYDSFYEKSLLNTPYRRRFANIAWLFSVGVLFPKTIGMIKILSMLPVGIVFKAVWHVIRAYGYFFHIRWVSIRDIIRKLLWIKKEGGVPFVER